MRETLGNSAEGHLRLEITAAAPGEGFVQTIAHELRGNALPARAVTLTPAAAATSPSGDTVEGEADAAAGQDIGNVAVSIDGEVSPNDIVYTAGPDVTTGITAQDIGIGQISFASDMVFDDIYGADDGLVTGNDEDNNIFSNTLADGGLPESAGDVDPTTPDELINAGGGNDTIIAFLGDDTIDGEEGIDS